MDISSINSDLIRGNVTTIILRSLLGEDRYGYDILREIEVKSENHYKLKQPTLYSCLKRLEKQKLITSYMGDESDTEGGRRRYYSLTDDGREYLQRMQAEYEYSRTILDKLLSDEEFDFDSKNAPFDINSLRPYTKRSSAENTDTENIEDNAELESKPVIHKIEPSAYAPLLNNLQHDSQQQENQENKVEYTEEAQKEVSTPLTAEGSSYDNHERRTTKSFESFVNIIDEKINPAPVVEETVQPENSENNELGSEDIENGTPSENEAHHREYYRPEKLTPRDTYYTNADKAVRPTLTDEQRRQRDEARRKLGLGARDENDEAQTSSSKYDKDYLLKKPANTGTGNGNFDNAPVMPQAQPSEHKRGNAKVMPGQLSFFDNDDTDMENQQYDFSDASKDILTPAEPKSEAEYVPAKKMPAPDEPKKSFFDFLRERSREKKGAEKGQTTVSQQSVSASTAQSTSDTTTEKETDSKMDFGFKNSDDICNYKNAFSDLRNKNESVAPDEPILEAENSVFTQRPASSVDLKNRLYSKGYKLKVYNRANTDEFYSMNYILANKLNRDCYALLYAILLIEVLIGHFIFGSKVPTNYHIAVACIGLVVPAVPFVIYGFRPDKRVRANFNFKLSLLSRLMLFLNLVVAVCLIGFFGLGADVNSVDTLLMPIFIPVLLFLNLPLSSVLYLALYSSKKYHIA